MEVQQNSSGVAPQTYVHAWKRSSKILQSTSAVSADYIGLIETGKYLQT